MVAKFKAWFLTFEKSKAGQQIFRFVRLTVFGALATVAAGTPITWAALAGALLGAAETSFRVVFPVPTPDPLPAPVPTPDPPKV